jgi:hypothetical protein
VHDDPRETNSCHSAVWMWMGRSAARGGTDRRLVSLRNDEEDKNTTLVRVGRRCFRRLGLSLDWA